MRKWKKDSVQHLSTAVLNINSSADETVTRHRISRDKLAPTRLGGQAPPDLNSPRQQVNEDDMKRGAISLDDEDINCLLAPAIAIITIIFPRIVP